MGPYHCSPFSRVFVPRWGDEGKSISIPCPLAIYDYFYESHSVDILSQLHYSYPIGRKARRCWLRLVWWLLDMCILNAFKLWSLGQNHISQLDFREQLMHELTRQLSTDQHPRKHGGHPPPLNALAKTHSSELSMEERDCKQCSRRPENRKRTNYICTACQVHLCLGECFREYHANA